MSESEFKQSSPRRHRLNRLRKPPVRFATRTLLAVTAITAVASAYFRTMDHGPRLSHIDGITITNDGNPEIRFLFNENASRQSVRQLLTEAKAGYALSWFDSLRRADGCIGGIGVITWDSQAFYVQYWSDRQATGPIPVTSQQAEDLLWACRNENSINCNAYYRNQAGCSIANRVQDEGRYSEHPSNPSLADYVASRIDR